MKKNTKVVFRIITATLVLLTLSVTVYAATMNDDWSTNSVIGYGYTTKGGLVFAAQKILNSSGMGIKVPEFDEIDGWYGPNTRNAVKQYQRDYGLLVDGYIGPQTWTDFAQHTMYIGSIGSTHRYKTDFFNGIPYTYFEEDYLNGWCVRNDTTGDFYLCNGNRFDIRYIIPL